MSITIEDLREIGKLVKQRRVQKGLTAKQLAREVGVSDAHIIYIEKGLRKASFDKIVNILDVLNLGVDEVLQRIGSVRQRQSATSWMRRIPVVTLVTAGQWREVCDSFEPGDADEWIESDIKGENVFALRVAGDSMEPEFKDGEIIIVDPHIESQPNDYVVVKNAQGEATFKQLKKYATRWVLHPLNPRHEDIELGWGEFKVIGKVVKKEKRY